MRLGELRRDEAELLAFFASPAEHWVHLQTANAIESPFATVRLRQRVTKGAGWRQKDLLLAFSRSTDESRQAPDSKSDSVLLSLFPRCYHAASSAAFAVEGLQRNR